MADIILRNGWNQPTTYYNVSSVSFATENGEATYYEEGTGIGGPSVQSDWLQDNPTEASYIKNKPFGRWRDAITDPVTTSSIETEDGRHQLDVPLSVGDFGLDGQIAVLWHQDLYLCDINSGDGGETYIGNNQFFTEENDIPFHGIYNEDTKDFTFFSKKPVNGIVVGLFSPEETIHKIDEGFLPNYVPDINEENLPQNWWGNPIPKDSLPQQWWGDTIPTDKLPSKWWGDPIEGGGSSGAFEQVQADWTENNEESPSFIKNKPTIPKDRSDDINAIQDELGLNDEGETRLDRIEDKLDNLDLDVDIGNIKGLDERFEKIEDALAMDEEGNSTRLDQINSRLDAVDGEEGAIVKINKHLSTIDNEDETAPGRIQQLSSRLDKLDDKENGEIKLIKDRLDDVEGEVDTIQQILQVDEEGESARLNAIDGEGGRLQQIDESLNEIDDTLIEHQENIEAIQTELGIDEEGNFTRLTEIEEAVEEHDGVIAKLKKDVAIQSDWNQESPEYKDYIKNRPFFKDIHNHVFSNEEWSKTEQTYQEVSIYENLIVFQQNNQHKQLSVKWKDKIYDLSQGWVKVSDQNGQQITSLSSSNLYGNVSLWIDSQAFHPSYRVSYVEGDKTAPFCFEYLFATVYKFYTIDNSINPKKIEIYTLQQLDKEFIPEEAFVPQRQADWFEEDITSPSYIINKPTLSNQQSDWNEVSNTSSSYINNKPFGYADAIFSEKEVTFTYDENSETYQASLGQLQNLIVGSDGDGESFSIYFDEQEFTNLKENWGRWGFIQTVNNSSYISQQYIGNIGICPYTPSGNVKEYYPAKNNLPFIVWTQKNGSQTDYRIATFDDSPTHKIRIEYTTPKKNLLSKQWLPADLVDTNKANQLFSEKVKQPDWNETNTSSPAYINNKPTALDPPDWTAEEGQGGFIKNKPTSQDFQANWNETDKNSLGYIKNLPSSFANWDAGYGEFGYIENKPSIPKVVYADWSVTSRTKKDYIYHRPFGRVKKSFKIYCNRPESGYDSSAIPAGYDVFYSKVDNDFGPDICEGETYTIITEDGTKYVDTVRVRTLSSKLVRYGVLSLFASESEAQNLEITYIGNISIVCPTVSVSIEDKIKPYCILHYNLFNDWVLEGFFPYSKNWKEVSLECDQLLKIPSRYLPDDFSSETINTLLSEIQQLKQQVQSLTDRVVQLESGGGSGDNDDDSSGASVEGTVLTVNGSVNSGILDLDGGRVENGILITTSTNNSTSTVENNELTTQGTVQNGILEGTGTVTNGIWEV